MNSGKIFMSAVMLTIFVVMVGIASQYPPQARFMPLVVGIPGIVLCLFQLFLEVCELRRVRNQPADTRNAFEKAQQQVSGIVGHQMDFEIAHEQLQVVQSALPTAGESRREILLWASFISLVAGLILFGFWLTIPLFLVLFLRYFADKGWKFSLGLGTAGTVVLFLVFHKGLKVNLHGGFITEFVVDRLASM